MARVYRSQFSLEVDQPANVVFAALKNLESWADHVEQIESIVVTSREGNKLTSEWVTCPDEKVPMMSNQRSEYDNDYRIWRFDLDPDKDNDIDRYTGFLRVDNLDSDRAAILFEVDVILGFTMAEEESLVGFFQEQIDRYHRVLFAQLCIAIEAGRLVQSAGTAPN